MFANINHIVINQNSEYLTATAIKINIKINKRIVQIFQLNLKNINYVFTYRNIYINSVIDFELINCLHFVELIMIHYYCCYY